jgi:hypothetical protein
MRPLKVLGLWLALASWAVPGCGASQVRSQERGSDWEVAVTDSAGLSITHKGDHVVTAKYLFWGSNWQWMASRWEVGTRSAAGLSFRGEVPRLKVRATGFITQPAANVLQYRYQVEAGEAFRDIMGGGLQFDLKLGSPTFSKCRDPILLKDNSGWEWPLADGQAVRVVFNPSVAKVFFERNQKSVVRALFLGSQIDPGTFTFSMTVTLPEGGRVAQAATERYGPVDTTHWYRGALRLDGAPVDLSTLNDRPAGTHGFVQTQGGRLVFADGTPARFWGTNVAAYALFADKRQVKLHAHRLAQLGYNLVRLHHHDTTSWVRPTVLDRAAGTSQQFDPMGLDGVDWWVKCLKDEGIYVWLDLHVGRQFKPGDSIEGIGEIEKRQGDAKGFNYFNSRIQELMEQFNAAYLSRVNRYTGVAYKDEPAVMGMLLTNENDVTHHFGNLMLADKGNPIHRAHFLEQVRAFAQASGLPAGQVERTWEPGSAKLFLNDGEHRFNQRLLRSLRQLGVRVPVATTNYWGNEALFSLPALTDGDVIDVHSYGEGEALSTNPRYEANFLSRIGAAAVYGKPLTITEWSVPFPSTDRFTAPLYLASIAALQGWDAPMIYNYAQVPLGGANRADPWSTYSDPTLAALMPAAALLYRAGHVRPARTTYCLQLDQHQLFDTRLDADTSAALRTLMEQSRVTIGLPAVPALPWLRPTSPGAGVRVVTNPDQDFVPAGQNSIESDTGELRRNWAEGIQTINTPKSQAASGWLGGREIRLRDTTLHVETPKATVVLTALDDKDLRESRSILITAVARAVAGPDGRLPFYSEPVTGTLTLQSAVSGLTLTPLSGDGRRLASSELAAKAGKYTVKLPIEGGTHWFWLTPSH